MFIRRVRQILIHLLPLLLHQGHRHLHQLRAVGAYIRRAMVLVGFPKMGNHNTVVRRLLLFLVVFNAPVL